MTDHDDDTDDDKPLVLKAVQDAMHELQDLWTRKTQAQEAYNGALAAVAEKSGFEVKVLRSFIAARMKDNVAQQRKYSDQLSLLFEETVVEEGDYTGEQQAAPPRGRRARAPAEETAGVH